MAAESELATDVTPVQALHDRGRLLLEEGPDDIRKRSTTYSRGGLLFLATGISIVLVGVAAVSLGIPGVFLRSFLYMFPFLGLTLAFVGGVISWAAKGLTPIRVFENGIEASTLRGTRVFFSYGELTGVEETTDPVAGAHYLFRTSHKMPAIAVRKDMRGFVDLLESIRGKLGNASYIVDLEPTAEEIRAGRKLEYAMYAVASLLGLALAATFSAAANPGDPLPIFLSGLGLVTPLFVILAVTLTGY